MSTGIEFLITHEPTLHDSIQQHQGEDGYASDRVVIAKRKLMEEVNIPIHCFHDHCHFTEVDLINKGLVKQLGIEGTFDGKRTFVLDKPMSVDQPEYAFEKKLHLKHIRFVGKRDKMIKTISLCLGAWGDATLYTQLNRSEVDVVVCGEICEYSTCEYVRDAAQLGVDMSLFVLGHMGSERSGMTCVVDYINENMDGVSAVYIESDEVFC